jgi:hypothetical protein
MSKQVMSIQEEEQFKIRLLEKEIKDLKADNKALEAANLNLRVDNVELKQACKALTKETITTADKIPIPEQRFDLEPWDYIREYKKVHTNDK